MCEYLLAKYRQVKHSQRPKYSNDQTLKQKLELYKIAVEEFKSEKLKLKEQISRLKNMIVKSALEFNQDIDVWESEIKELQIENERLRDMLQIWKQASMVNQDLFEEERKALIIKLNRTSEM